MGSPRRNPSDLVSRLKGPSPLPVQRGGQQPKMRSSSISAIPTHYYVLFAIYEPCLTTIGFLGALIDPKATHDSQAPWPNGIAPDGLPLATRLTIVQLGHVCALLGLINVCILSAARKHLAFNPALQEKIASALLIPLLIGDIAHLYLSLYALGPGRWDVLKWSPMLVTTVLLGFSLLIPRVMWFMGVGRYVDSRDGPTTRSSA